MIPISRERQHIRQRYGWWVWFKVWCAMLWLYLANLWHVWKNGDKVSTCIVLTKDDTK